MDTANRKSARVKRFWFLSLFMILILWVGPLLAQQPDQRTFHSEEEKALGLDTSKLASSMTEYLAQGE